MSRRKLLMLFAASVVAIAGFQVIANNPTSDAVVRHAAPTADVDAAPVAGAARHFLWQAQGKHNRVYLYGSVHMLRNSDYPLPAPVMAAYDDAERIVLEIDLDDLDPVYAQTLMARLGRIADGESLETLMGQAAWRTASARADAIGLDLGMLARVEPWVAAITVVNVELARLGFSPEAGVEMFFSRRAMRDSKPVTGLETIEYQLGLFDSLPLQLQSEFLLKSLDDAGEMANEADVLIGAWKNADLELMERQMLEGFEGVPHLYDILVKRRNLAWVDALVRMLDEKDDYFVVVGAMHLVGQDSLLTLLAQRGIVFRQQ